MPPASAQLARDSWVSCGKQVKLPTGRIIIFHVITMQKKKTAGESLMKSLAVLPADSLWTRATDMNHISVLNDRK